MVLCATAGEERISRLAASFLQQKKENSSFTEAVVVVREKESSSVLEVLNQFGGVTLQFSLVCIPDSEDWGTADSLRHIRGKLKVIIVVTVSPSNVLFFSCNTVMSWL